jgi:hypothetical protein
MHDAGLTDPGNPLIAMPTIERVRMHYGRLCAAAETHFGAGTLGGRLLLVDGLRAEGDALLLAASIAGAASVVLERNPGAVRYAVRNGIVDFAVTTLDEALRILKNEVRKQQPIAVLLEHCPDASLAGLVERGAQPDLVRWAAGSSDAETLLQRGARPVPESGPTTGWSSADRVVWRAGDGGSAALRQVDLLASQVVPLQDIARQNWIARAPRYLHRAMRLERCVPMSEAEVTALLAALEERAQQNALAAPVEVESRAQVRRFASAV